MPSKPLPMDEAKEIYNNIATRLTVAFSSYYKYSFTFRGEVDGVEVALYYGGNSDDIYKESIDTKQIDAPENWDAIRESYSGVHITAADGRSDYYDFRW